MPRRIAQTEPSLAGTTNQDAAIPAASIQPQSRDLGSSTSLQDAPVWVKLTDLHGTLDDGRIRALVTETKPTEYGSVSSVPYCYFLRYDSPRAAERALQSGLAVCSEIVTIDPVALFPDWENQVFAFPVEFIGPNRRIKLWLQKTDSTTKGTQDEALEIFANRLQSRWRFVRVAGTAEISLYLPASSDANELRRIEALAPPGFKAMSVTKALDTSTIARNPEATPGCIRTPISEERSLRQTSRQPYPPVGPLDAPPEITRFDVYPVWIKPRSLAEREAVQRQIETLLIPTIQADIIEYSRSKSSGVTIETKSGASYTLFLTRFHRRSIDPKHEDIYWLAVVPLTPVAQKVGVKPVPVLSKQADRKEKEKGKGKAAKGKDAAKGKGGKEGGPMGTEEAILLTERSSRRLEIQAKNPGKPWIRVPWRMEDEAPEPTRSADEYDVPLPTDLNTLANKVFDWINMNRSTLPDHQTLQAIFGNLPTDEPGLKVLAQMRAGTANPYQLVRELAKSNFRIGLDDGAVYYLLLRVRLGDLPSALNRIGKVPGVQRARICLQLQETHDRLRKKGLPESHELHITYGGDTICLRDRSGLDMIDIIHVGDDRKDHRRPMTVLMDFAANVCSLSEFGVVTSDDDGIWLWGDPDVVLHRLPKVLRIPVVKMNGASPSVKRHAERVVIGTMHPFHVNVLPGGRLDYQVDEHLTNDVAKEIVDVTNPMEDVLWLGDAPGTKGRSFEDSHTGLLVVGVMQALLGDQDFTIAPLEWHGLDRFHPSNIIVCTTPEITFVIDGIKPGNVLIVIIGTRVALFNTLTHLLGSTIKPEEMRFFQPYSMEYEQIQRIFIVLPHPGLHNYIAYTNWTREAFAQGLARICLIAATIKRLQPSVSDSKALVSQTLASLKSSAVNAKLEKSLSLYGIRAPWNGSTASKIGTLIDLEKISFEEALAVVSSRGDRTVITNLAPPTRDCPRWEVPTLFPRVDSKYAYVGQMSIPTFCPASPKNGVPEASVKSILVDARWRKKSEDTEGHLFVDPSTMELKFEVVGGGIHVNDDGDPFIIKRAIWMTSTSLGAGDKIIENLLRLSGTWKDITLFETRELRARVDKSDYSIVTRSNLIHTFLAAEVEDGLRRGDVTLIKIGTITVDFRVWKQSVQAFVLLQTHEWKPPKEFFDNRDGATHFALTYNFGLKRWEFPLYKICEENGWNPTFVCLLDKVFPSSTRNNYFVKNAETTELFKIQQLQYTASHAGNA